MNEAQQEIIGDFNSHAHVERDFFLYRLFLSFCHFNSHAHVERDIPAAMVGQGKKISTHTLTWSVTVMGAISAFTADISTHTLTWSVTTAEIKLDGDNAISTHTLTWSVTGKRSVGYLLSKFQLTRSRGA